MTIWDLIRKHEHFNPDSCFFNHETLKFFGERISEMKVLKKRIFIKDCQGKEHICYVVSKISHNHPSGSRRTYAFFDITTLENIIEGE